MASAGPRQADAPFRPDIHLLIPGIGRDSGRSGARPGSRRPAL